MKMTGQKSKKQFIIEAIEIHGNYYDYSEFIYAGHHTKGSIICPKHGKFEQTPKHHVKRKQGCNKCSMRPKRNLEEFIKAARLIHIDNYDYSLVIFINMRTKITIICNTCKLKFEQRPDHHLRKIGCPNCIHTVSKSETEWLDYMGVPNDQEHRQVIIKIESHKYKVDGFIPKTNTIYEFNGDYWHGNPSIFDSNDLNKKSKETFGQLYDKTCLKLLNIEKSGYKVISIWESDWERQKNCFVNKIA